ncbi:MAG: AIPR family protein [Gaiellaceae bacterium]
MSQPPEFNNLEAAIQPYFMGNRTKSAALLAWFLENVWRMEPEDVDEAICDGGGDKGIDALTVDDDLTEITVFQSKHRENERVTQGDVDLKTQVGSAVYFESPDAVDRLLQSSPNPELAALLARLKIREKVANGAHAACFVFVTNADLDAAGRDYAVTVEERDPPLDVWDRSRLAVVAVRTQRPELLPDRVTLTAAAPPTVLIIDANGTKLVVGLIPAKELVTLPGVGNLSIFAPNVRLGLGKTPINRDLALTVKTTSEHALFPAYHNGLTVLTNALHIDGNEIRLDGISVVNGCQSLLTLHEHKDILTDDLIVLVKAIQVDTTGQLPDKITYRTNSQNGVDIRDQRSRDPIQRDLQSEVREVYGNSFGFAIRRGETINAGEVLSNESAAQMIMAVYLGEPWSAVRKVRLFDADYHRIFNRSMNAHKLYLIAVLIKAVVAARERLRPDLASSFSSVRFTLAFLLVQVLSETEQGKALLNNPERFLPDQRAEVEEVLTTLAQEVAESTNTFVENEEAEANEKDEPYDPKVAFKSRVGVQRLQQEVIRLGRRLAKSDPSYFFQIDPVR